MTVQQEKKNERAAMITSVAVHSLLFLAFFFVVAWRAPNPPLPEYGIELNFGLDSQGSGEVQPVTPSGSETQANEEEQQVKNEKPDDETKPVIEDKSQPDHSKPVEQSVTTKQESPVTVKEEKKEQLKPVEKPVEKPKEKTETKPEVKPKETESKATTTADKTTATDKEGKPVSQGDKTDKTGDQGDPKGTPDAKALYGNQGGGAGGIGLELAGWTWDYIPKPNVPNNESGRIVFEIKVNAEGELEGYRVIERSVSPEAEKACREAIEKLTFTRKDGAIVPALSTGKITFVIRSN
jgi:protein TonB